MRDAREGVEPTWCPCGKRLDAATPIGSGAQPSEGDLSLCVYCGRLSRFDSNGSLHTVDDQKAELARCSPRVRSQIERGQAAIRRMREGR